MCYPVALAAIILLLGAGLCLAGVDHAGSGVLCGAALSTIGAGGLALLLPLPGRLIPALAAAYRYSPSDLPAPPPKR